jgi:SAM-dependent methyltransferase
MNACEQSCRGCGGQTLESVVDLGSMPLANSYIKPALAARADINYPLHAYVCRRCWLVQVPPVVSAAHIFSDYAYYSSYSQTWLAHCRHYAQAMIARLKLHASSQVVEVASNDGILLQQFQMADIAVLGVEPAQNIAAYANAKNIPTRNAFFGKETAQQLLREGVRADLMIANNVLAHVPDLHDFVAGFGVLLAPGGTITFEFPHLLEMLKHTQFDTIYHEHFSYLSLTALAPVFAAHGLVMVDVERLPVHGGSLRVFVQHTGADVATNVAAFLSDEIAFGLTDMASYRAFDASVRRLKTDLLAMLKQLHQQGKRVAAYGAPAKGNTLLNYCGIDTKLVAYTVDRNPEKQGCLLPGSRLPIYAPEHVLADKPDILFILPWNIAPEVMQQMDAVRSWGGQFLVAVPQPHLL